MKLVYVTSSLPHGPLEAFVLPEIAALQRLGHEVWIVPMYPRGRLVHEDAESHLKRTLSEPLLSAEVAGEAVRELPAAPGRALSLLARIAAARPRIAVKNVTVYPKGLWLARRIRELEAEHVHAHWASVSATLALTGAELAGVPWSFTAHRWDIRESNLLRTKARSACFVRTISESGARDLRERIGLDGWSPTVIRMGVDLPAATAPVREEGPLRLLTAANLLPVKGHRYLFEALAGQEGITLDVAGEGPLRAELENRARGLPVTFLGAISHAELLERLRAGSWDAVVLPSAPTDDGDQEGVPVSLIESMASGVPVVSTASGAIPELVTDSAGLLVPPRDSPALAAALERLREPALRRELAAAGRARVEAEFDVERIAAELAARFAAC